MEKDTEKKPGSVMMCNCQDTPDHLRRNFFWIHVCNVWTFKQGNDPKQTSKFTQNGLVTTEPQVFVVDSQTPLPIVAGMSITLDLTVSPSQGS